ncbi:hypothetical protein [Corynebacterium sp. HMSC061H03]|uniref:hypothetical protein n=1 Tax=Corynebacterium sp. HMSC061H03 TaxID=1739291 RepID=UPI001AEFD31C|nr:hypothetical protein [Corynebacterium sp. HMSC061H03]
MTAGADEFFFGALGTFEPAEKSAALGASPALAEFSTGNCVVSENEEAESCAE